MLKLKIKKKQQSILKYEGLKKFTSCGFWKMFYFRDNVISMDEMICFEFASE